MRFVGGNPGRHRIADTGAHTQRKFLPLAPVRNGYHRHRDNSGKGGHGSVRR